MKVEITQNTILSFIIGLVFLFGIFVIVMSIFFPRYMPGYGDERRQSIYPDYDEQCTPDYMGGCN